MPLDPLLARLINKAYLSGFGDIHHFSSEEMRNYLRHPKLNITQASFIDFTTSHAIKLRCYTPSVFEPSQKLPVIIYLSATAFVLDRLDANNDYCSLLANTLGMKVISISHRLAPEYKFPYFLNDCLDSIEWIYTHAAEIGIAQNKIALWGESSGASIAATCTHVFRDKNLPYIQHQTLLYPMVSLITPFESKSTYAHGFMLDRSFIEWLDSQGFRPDQDRSCPLASPLLNSNFQHLPPATIITAEYDPLRDEGEAYANKLIAANIDVSFKRMDGMIHGFMRFYPKVKGTQTALNFATNALMLFFKKNTENIPG